MNEQKKEYDDFEAAKILVGALEKFNDEERARIIKWACEKLGSKNVFRSNNNESIADFGDIKKHEELAQRTSMDIKTFVESKNPVNDAQFVATIAYYYKFEAPEESRREFIASDVVNESARLVGRKRLSNPVQTLHNAYSHSGYLDKVDHGKYKLNTVGENLVAMVLAGDSSQVTKKRKNIAKKIPKNTSNKSIKKAKKQNGK